MTGTPENGDLVGALPDVVVRPTSPRRYAPSSAGPATIPTARACSILRAASPGPGANMPVGYAKTRRHHLGRTFEEVGGYDEIVLLKDIPFQSHCEHHMAPIIGKAAIAYLPNQRGRITKLARVLHGFARRLQVQERLTAQVADGIWDISSPGRRRGDRGEPRLHDRSRRRHARLMMTTSRMMGAFREDERSRREVLALMGY